MTTGEEVDTSRWPAGTIGATSGSIPLPSPTPTTVYQPFRPEVEVQLHVQSTLTSLGNRLDDLERGFELLKIRADFLEEAIMGLMEQKNFNDDYLIGWFKRNREKFGR